MLLLQISVTGAGLYGERLAIVLGFITLVLALATFASCRSCLSLLGRAGIKNLTEKVWYRRFYKFHGYYWFGFILSLVLHMLSATMHTGFPTIGDPDAGIHWIILSLALGAFAFTLIILASCRSLLGMVNLFAEKGPQNNPGFRRFNRFHSYYWLIFILASAGHFAAAYSHVGFWPG